MSNLDRDIVRKTLKGYREINQITDQERKHRLQNLSDDEARQGFEQLCSEIFDLYCKHSSFDERSLEHKLRLRRVFAKLAKKWGYESTL